MYILKRGNLLIKHQTFIVKKGEKQKINVGDTNNSRKMFILFFLITRMEEEMIKRTHNNAGKGLKSRNN